MKREPKLVIPPAFVLLAKTFNERDRLAEAAQLAIITLFNRDSVKDKNVRSALMSALGPVTADA